MSQYAEIKFNTEALYVDLDRKRRAARITWRELARQAEVSASTATRIAHGQTPSVDGLTRLLYWLGRTDIEPYIRLVPGRSEP